MRLPFLFMDGRSARIPDKIRPMPERGGEVYAVFKSDIPDKILSMLEKGGDGSTLFFSFQMRYVSYCLTPTDANHHDQ